MRWCPSCRRISPGQPERCHYCGRTWNLRLCPSGHENPPDSQYCGLCGSARLSEPAQGGNVVNGLFALFQHRGHIARVLFSIAAIALVCTVLFNLGAFAPLLIALIFLFIVLWLSTGFLHDRLLAFIVSFIRAAIVRAKLPAIRRHRRGRQSGT
jgi:hypothetical protein